MSSGYSFNYVGYRGVHRHWCPRSEKYTGVDSLFGMLDRGWQPNSRLLRRDIALGGTRNVVVYYFELKHQQKTVKMAVIANPVLDSFLLNNDFQVMVQVEQPAAFSVASQSIVQFY